MKIIKSLEDLKIDDVQFEDKIIICKDCGEEFIFTVNEQNFFNEKGLQDPKRCKECRKQKKLKRAKKIAEQDI